MTSPPDKTFRDKLLDYQKPAPPEAWDRIEKGLEGSGSKGIWLKVAAAVMVLAIPLFILWPKTQDESIAVTNSKHVVDEPDVAEEKAENPGRPFLPCAEAQEYCRHQASLGKFRLPVHRLVLTRPCVHASINLSVQNKMEW